MTGDSLYHELVTLLSDEEKFRREHDRFNTGNAVGYGHLTPLIRWDGSARAVTAELVSAVAGEGQQAFNGQTAHLGDVLTLDGASDMFATIETATTDEFGPIELVEVVTYF